MHTYTRVILSAAALAIATLQAHGASELLTSSSGFPSSCTSGAILERTDQGASGRVYLCGAGNTWLPLAASEISPALPSPGARAKLAPQNTAVTGTANCCLSPGEGSKWTMGAGNTYRVRMAGTIDRLRFFYGSPCGTYTGIYITVWRPDPLTGGSYDLVGQTENLLPKITRGVLNDITLSVPVPVAAGDYLGTREVGTTATNNCGPWLLTADTNLNTTYQADLATYTAYTWGAPITGQGIVIEAYSGTSPQLLTLGDSLISGYPTGHDACDGLSGAAGSWSPTTTIGAAVAAALHITWIDCGWSGQTTAQILARMTTDATSAAPRVLLLDGGVNDITGGATTAAIIANWTAELSAAQTAGMRTLALLVLPAAGYLTDTQMQKRDQVNTAIRAAAAATGATVVDAGPYVGMYKTTGPTGNTWTLQPAYDSGDHVHLTPAGYARVGDAVVDAIAGRGRR
jgi:lysophospholipase L1-like esterase